MSFAPYARTVLLEDRTQNYVEYGDPGADPAHTILMVHGLRGTWQGLDRLARALPTYRILVPSLPGFGGEPDLAGGNTIDNYSVWLRKFTAAVGLSGHTVLGHSFGSIVVAASSGSIERATILVNPVAVAASNGPHPVLSRGASALYGLAHRLPENVGNWVLSTPIHVRVMSLAMAKTSDRDLRAWIHRQHDMYYSSYTSRQGVYDAFRESISLCVGDFADRIHTPTLLIAGEKDDIAAVSDQQRLAEKIPTSQLHIIEGVGHLIHYERPAEAAALIDRWIRALG